MTPLLIVKTAHGFAVAEFKGEIPVVPLTDVLCFGELENSLSYRNDGVLHAIKQHFKEPEVQEGAP